MSILSVGAGNLPRYRLRGRVSTVRASSDEMELRAGEPRRLDGDYRWRAIICHRGVIWITQERDLHDYVLTAGEMFLVTLPGSVMVQALEDASVLVTPSIRAVPYVGNYVMFP
jgi:hypothetical protein